MFAIDIQSKEAMKLRNLLRLMLTKGVFKIDHKEGFVLKSGMKSPIYIDLRESFGYPEIMELACDCLKMMISATNQPYDGIVGVPYAALPYSSIVALGLSKPLIIIRKEAKSYGTKKLIEGRYEKGQTVVIIEDVVTTGGSICDVVKILEEDGLIIKDVFCLLDRQQGGAETLQKKGITLHSLLNMELILSFLLKTQAIDEPQMKQIIAALNLPFESVPDIQIGMELEGFDKGSRKIENKRLPISERQSLTTNPLNKKIFGLMLKKKSNICLAIDYETSDDILKLAETAGSSIIALKIHIDIIVDFSQDFARKLRELADRHDFLIFEDRKFADIGNVTDLQLKGMYRIGEWADVVTCHAVQGIESITGAFKKHLSSNDSRVKGVLLIAQLSSKGALTNEDYAKKAITYGEENEDIIAGFICQEKATNSPGLINWTPGVNQNQRSDGLGQQWRTIDQAIIEQGNDIVILGRAITASQDPIKELNSCQKAAWKALTGEE